ncbi:tetratricopeptide repeat protein [Salinivibrio sp. DV]|uniref:tetratricopeptide repeat protein n=1 Tax=Salinivibrio sp. SS2 TaxID=1892894 RepID=UPI00084CDA1B|nr:hypothetical protein [Salinivibrio sp. DV]ODQ00621.1 hypothetical protein BGK46_06110 [Salinivibrio sp. DV]
MANTYPLTIGSHTYQISKRWRPTMDQDGPKSVQLIDTDRVMLSDQKRVVDYKSEFKAYKAKGGKQKQKDYLDAAANRDFGAPWDTTIDMAKKEMNNLYWGQKDWITKEDHQLLFALADSGHAHAAYHLGTQLTTQDDYEWAIKFLVDSHNFGHLHAIFVLAEYLFEKKNIEEAIACLVIAGDKGNNIATLTSCHFSIFGLMTSCNGEKLEGTLQKLTDLTPYTTARYLKLYLLISQGRDIEALQLLNNIIENPQNPPPKKFSDETFEIRGEKISNYFAEVKQQLFYNDAPPSTIPDRIGVFEKVGGRYGFPSFDDFKSLRKLLEREINGK